jgi:hypothetical protein
LKSGQFEEVDMVDQNPGGQSFQERERSREIFLKMRSLKEMIRELPYQELLYTFRTGGQQQQQEQQQHQQQQQRQQVEQQTQIEMEKSVQTDMEKLVRAENQAKEIAAMAPDPNILTNEIKGLSEIFNYLRTVRERLSSSSR